MDNGIKLITVLLVVLLVFAGLSWSQSGRTQSTQDRPYVNDSNPLGATPLADDNKIVGAGNVRMTV